MKGKKIVSGLWILAGVLGVVLILPGKIRKTENGPLLSHPLRDGTSQIMQHRASPSPHDENDLLIIRLFLKRMDSLRRDPSGKKEYDSICHARPGLIDSALTAERYYLLWNKLK